MKKLGVLIIGREYFLPYVSWLTSMDGQEFEISGYIDNEDDIYASHIGTRYTEKRNNYTLEELVTNSDMILSLGYWRIIPKEIIDASPMGILNLHHSYKLQYRGRHTVSWAIINEEKFHGTTLHYMSKALDDGPILSSRKVPISPDDTAFTLFTRVNDVGLTMLKEMLPIALDPERVKHVKLQQPDERYSLYKKNDLKHEIPSTMLADDKTFAKHVRALTFPGMPPPYVIMNGIKIYLSADSPKQ